MSALSPRQMFLLDEACRPIRQAFGVQPYLVGSAMAKGGYRDVDVRLILEDEQYDALNDIFGPMLIPLLGIAFGQYLVLRTGLPIDFQIQRQSVANEQHKGPRNPMGVRSLVDYAGDGHG